MDDDEILAQAGQIEAERMLAAAMVTPEEPEPVQPARSGDVFRDAAADSAGARNERQSALTERIFR